jgi:hypothetical protein
MWCAQEQLRHARCPPAKTRSQQRKARVATAERQRGVALSTLKSHTNTCSSTTSASTATSHIHSLAARRSGRNKRGRSAPKRWMTGAGSAGIVTECYRVRGSCIESLACLCLSPAQVRVRVQPVRVRYRNQVRARASQVRFVAAAVCMQGGCQSGGSTVDSSGPAEVHRWREIEVHCASLVNFELLIGFITCTS